MAARITAIILTRNEEAAIDRCLEAVAFCDQVIVVDSASEDRTIDIAAEHGADVVQFSWNGRYPKKKQWSIEHEIVRHDWILLLDADEIVSAALAEEIRRVISAPEASAYDIPLQYHFAGKALRHGHRVSKRSLIDRRVSRFPEVGDLDAPGITEVEGHYQPEVMGSVSKLRSALIHEDPDPVSTWFARHNRYSDWEAYLAANRHVRENVRSSRTEKGQIFDRLPGKHIVFFLYSYVLRLGFLDGRAGLDYALALTWYYWSIGLKVREQERCVERRVR